MSTRTRNLWILTIVFATLAVLFNILAAAHR